MAPDYNVIACIPYFRCQRYIRRAVESLLAQTHKRLLVVVINDADYETPPWSMLEHIRDTRLVRFDLPINRGPYYATQVVLEATRCPYFLIQDADDWSHSERVERLYHALNKEKTDVAISARLQFREHENGTREALHSYIPKEGDFKLDSKIKFRIPHHGLFRAQSLKNIGGYYGGYRMSYDMLVTNLILMTGRVSVVPYPLYYYCKRPDSLTVCANTGMRSESRKRVNEQLQILYSKAYAVRDRYLRSQISGSEFCENLRRINVSGILSEDMQYLYEDSNRLLSVL